MCFAEQPRARPSQCVQRLLPAAAPLRERVGIGEVIEHFEMRCVGEPHLAEWQKICGLRRCLAYPPGAAQVRQKRFCELGRDYSDVVAATAIGNTKNSRQLARMAVGKPPRPRLATHPDERNEEDVLRFGNVDVQRLASWNRSTGVIRVQTAYKLTRVHAAVASLSSIRRRRSCSASLVGRSPSSNASSRFRSVPPRKRATSCPRTSGSPLV